MKAKILSLDEHRDAQRRKENGAPGAGKSRLPGSEQLWQLLDRNINVTVWRNESE